MLTRLIEFVFGTARHISRRRWGGDRPIVASITIDPSEVDTKLAVLSQARPDDVIHIGPKLAAELLPYMRNIRAVAQDLMHQNPTLAWLLTFHYDGRIREAALRTLSRSPTTTSQFIALALRLNDWVPEVRATASEAALRVYPNTAAEVIVAATPYLLARRYLWTRWNDEAFVLDGILARADVAAVLAEQLAKWRVGSAGITLRMALRFPSLDQYLPALAARSCHPAVRATAFETLIKGEARWSTSCEWIWVDKRYGIRRRQWVIASRPLSLVFKAEPLIRVGLADRFATVRKVAISGLYEKRASMSDAAELARSLLDDTSFAVRDRAAFLIRRLSEEG